MSNRTSSKADEKVQVTVRCRPTNQSERQHRVKKVVECNSKSREVNVVTAINTLGLTGSQQTKVYNFDKVFGPNCSQIDVYKNVVESQLQDVLAGYNCTVLAYGQTGTGKTYTMEGERSIGEDYSWDTDPRAGLIPRALSQLFDCLEQAGCEFSVRVSLLEIYNEDIYDLLSHSAELLKMKIYEDNNRKGSVVVSGLTEVHVRHKSEVYEILQQGAAKRRTAATNLNEFSSRSHSVFSVTVHTKDITQNRMEEEELVKIGKLNLVDLAGSENIGRSGAVDKRAREAGSINQSLLTLGRCITALVDRAPHIPYRESKLTRLLQDSLGGATKTSIIATISPGSDNLEETMSTLDYAARAKNIHNKPRVNQKLTKRALIKEYDDEIEKLRREVVALREKNGVYVDPKQYDEMVAKIEGLTATIKQREEDVQKFQELFTNASEELEERTERLNILHDDLVQTRKELAEQCRLKNAYMDHGTEVAEQAAKLLETADIVANDLDKVHDKVDRSKSVNKSNINTLGSFSGKLKEDIELLCDGTQGILKQNKASVQKTMRGFGTFRDEQKQILDSLSSLITEWNQAMCDSCKETSRSLNIMSDKLSGKVEEIDGEINQQKNDLKEQMDKHDERIKKFTGVSDQLTRLIETMKKSTQLHCEQAEAQSALTCEHDDKIHGYVDSMKSVMATLVESQKTKMHNLMEMQRVKWEELQASMRRGMEDMTAELNTGYDITNEKSDAMLRSASAFVEQTSIHRDDRITEAKDTEEMVVNVLNDCVASIRKSSTKSIEDMNSMRDVVGKNADDLSRACSKMRDECTSAVEKCNKQPEAAAERSSSCEIECHTLLSDLGHSQDGQLDNFTDIIQIAEDKMQVAIGALEEGKSSITEEVDEYYANKFKQIVPTGLTPARKVYQYSNQISQPPLEEDILHSFRERMLEEEDSQEEDEKIDEDLEDHENDAGSLPSKSDSGMSEGYVEPNLDQSITIPDVGGIPFFKRKGTKSRIRKYHAPRAQTSTRIPLRPMQNLEE